MKKYLQHFITNRERKANCKAHEDNMIICETIDSTCGLLYVDVSIYHVPVI